MTASERLFSIIKTMSPSEKRYFKLFAARNTPSGKNNPIALFDALDKQNPPDAENVRKALGKEIRNIPATQCELRALLLKSLHAFHSGATVHASLSEQLHYLEILYDKALYDECKKILQKAKRIAQENDSYLFQLFLLGWESKISRMENFRHTPQQEIDALHGKEQFLLEQYKHICAGKNLHDRFFFLHNQYTLARSGDKMLQLRSMLTASSAMLGKDIPLTAKLDVYMVMSAFHHAAGNTSASHRYMKKFIHAIESRPNYLHALQGSYINAMVNSVVLQIERKKYRQAISLLHGIRNISPINRNNKTKIFTATYLLDLSIYLETGKFSNAASLAGHVQKKMSGYILRPADELQFCWYFAYSYFGVSNFKEAKHWINKILAYKPDMLRTDLKCFARILQLLVSIEKKDADFTEHEAKATKRFIMNKHSFYKMEEMLIGFLYKHSAQLSNKQSTATYKNLQDKIASILKNTHEKQALRYFDIISWLESKIENRSFAEVVREKAGK